MSHNFPKFYNKFRTCISLPIHWYITYKLIQNILKNIWNSKGFLKNCFRPSRSTGQSTGAYGRPKQSTGRSPGLWPRAVHFCARCLLTDKSTANPCCRPTESHLLSIWAGRLGRWLTFYFFPLNCRAVDRSQWLFSGWAGGRPAGWPTACQLSITTSF